MEALLDFVRRCDEAAAALKIKRSTLSTLVFNDGKRIDQIASGRSDVGVRRLGEAEHAVAALVADRSNATA